MISHTDAEQILWTALLSDWHMKGWKSQYKLGFYRLDFYNPEARLCVEADGYHHWWKQRQVEHDKRRTLYLRRFRIEVLRFSNRQIEERLPFVIAEITEAYDKGRILSAKPQIEWYREKASSLRGLDAG